MIRAIIYPIGFMPKASSKFPFVNEMIERVEPQEGQGIFARFFNKQPYVVLPSFAVDAML